MRDHAIRTLWNLVVKRVFPFQRALLLRGCVIGCALLGIAFQTHALETQTITFSALPNKTFGDSSFAIYAVANSGLMVLFSTQTTAVCTLSGTQATIVGGGTCTIDADQPGNITYGPAPRVSQSFTVAKATQSITSFPQIGTQTFTNGGSFAVSATASSGLTVAFESTTPQVCTVTGQTVSILDGGACTIVAKQPGNDNYLAAPDVLQQIAIKRTQTITFGPISAKELGDAPFTLSGTASSGLAVTWSTTTSSICTIDTGTVTLRAAGTCTIASDQVGSSLYLPAAQVVQSFPVKDLTPDSIVFSSIESAPLGVLVFSNAATVNGISESVDISIEGGEYSIGCTKDFVSTPGTIGSGSLLCVRHLSAAAPLTTTTTKVTVGRTVATFESKSEPPDTTPDQFHFNDVTNVEPGSSVVSLPVPIQGINIPATVTVVGGEYSVGCTSTFLSDPGTVSKGDVVCVRLTAASGFSAVKTAILTVGGVSDQFSTLTKAKVDPTGFSESLTRIPGIDNVTKLYRDPTNSARVIATTGSGFAVSEDTGITWTSGMVTDGSTNSSISLNGMSVDTATPGTWYAIATTSSPPLYGQLYRSPDYGKTWSSMRLDSVTSGFQCFGINPANPQFLVLALTKQIGTTPEASIAFYVSQTGGGSWTLVTTSIPTDFTPTYDPACEFAFDGVSTNAFYFLTGKSATSIYRVESAGKTVTTVYVPTQSNGMTYRSSLAKLQDTKSASQLWMFTQCFGVLSSTDKCEAQLAVDSSIDGGKTFNRLSTGSLGVSVPQSFSAPILSLFRLMDFSSDSWLGSRMVVMSQLMETYQYPVPSAIFESVSGGSSWQQRALPDGVTTPKSVLAMSNDGDGALLAATEKGVFRKRFGEADWQNSSMGLKAATVNVVAASRVSSSTVMVGTKEAGIYLTTNGGNTWNSANKGLPPFSNIVSGCFDSASDSLGYAVVGTSLYRTTDRSTTWSPPPTDPPLTNVRGVYCPNGKPNVVYAAGSGGLFTLARSDNAGVSWTNITGLDGAAVISLAPSPGTDTIFVAASTGLFRSTSKDNLAKVGSSVFTRIAVSPTNLLNIYAVTSGYMIPLGNETFEMSNVRMSEDGGVTWRDINPPQALLYGGGSLQYWKSVTGIAVHPTSAGVIFVSSSAGGVFASFDNGLSWSQLGTSTSIGSAYSLDLLFAGVPKAALGASKMKAASNITDTLLVIAGGADGYVSRLALSAPAVTAPVCSLTATPSSITAGGSSTLTSSCTPAATAYVWTGGSCAGTTGASCTVTPSTITTYTITGTNAGGTGGAASAGCDSN